VTPFFFNTGETLQTVATFQENVADLELKLSSMLIESVGSPFKEFVDKDVPLALVHFVDLIKIISSTFRRLLLIPIV
jgi:hypothetical protein